MSNVTVNKVSSDSSGSSTKVVYQNPYGIGTSSMNIWDTSDIDNLSLEELKQRRTILAFLATAKENQNNPEAVAQTHLLDRKLDLEIQERKHSTGNDKDSLIKNILLMLLSTMINPTKNTGVATY